MASLRRLLVAAAAATVVNAASLSDVCTTSYAQAALPVDFYPGITINSSSVSTSLVTNDTVSNVFYPTTTIDYCNVTFAYSHNGITGDVVHVSYWLPPPDSFQNRYVSTGGGGLAINSGSSSIPTGIIVGAVSGMTDGGFGNFDTEWDAVFLLANNTINWQATYMFGYQAHHELATVGKEFARNLYNVSNSKKVYSYYQGCSKGGREGWSQLQRFADQFDGAAVGAPAFHYGQQQVNHLIGNVVEQTLNYFPPSCELEKIMNLTIAACDPMDGLTDGIISRSDLCKLNFDLNSTIGQAYSCAASTSASTGFGALEGRSINCHQFPVSSQTPAQNGTVSAEGAAVAKRILMASTIPKASVSISATNLVLRWPMQPPPTTPQPTPGAFPSPVWAESGLLASSNSKTQARSPIWIM